MDVLDGADVPSPAGFALVRAYRTFRHEMDAALREVGLTTPQWGALSCLNRMGGLSGAEMARIQCTTPQTMHTVLTHLEQSGYIVRKPGPSHGHMLLVQLTDDGRAALERAAERVADVDRRLTSCLSARERETLLSLLTRCMGALPADRTHDA